MEQWKVIDEFSNYAVSDMGEIKNLTTGHILKPRRDRYGYLTVNFRKDGKVYCRFIHRLVATAYLENPLNKEQVNHKDYNPLNNCVYNLEWTTPKENSQHSICRHAKTRSQRKDGELFIYWSKIKNRYLVQLRKIHHQKQFRTLPEAVAYRDKMLKELNYGTVNRRKRALQC